MAKDLKTLHGGKGEVTAYVSVSDDLDILNGAALRKEFLQERLVHVLIQVANIKSLGSLIRVKRHCCGCTRSGCRYCGLGCDGSSRLRLSGILIHFVTGGLARALIFDETKGDERTRREEQRETRETEGKKKEQRKRKKQN
jgi:hypothetical protein